MNEILLYFAIKYEGDWDQIYSAINRKEKVNTDELKDIIKKETNKFITLIDKEYPSRLKNIYKPPFVLFYRGDLSLINTTKKTIGVVGSRKADSYGKKITENLVKELVNNDYVIVSGLAKGIDSVAHKTCLENKGKTIAVIGNGLNQVYPIENEKLQEQIATFGLIISEYPSNINACKDHFPRRNRIVAGLSDAILVTQASNKSGAMITVSRALELGKDVFCVPDTINKESGCNRLIKEGAKLVENVEDILIEM